MPANAEVVRRLAAAFEEGDTDAAVACLDPDVELLPIRAQLEGASYTGHEGYLAVIALFEQDWEGLRVAQDEIRENGDLVVALGRLTARGRTSGVELDVPMALLYELRDGRVVRVESFTEPADALRAAGLEP